MKYASICLQGERKLYDLRLLVQVCCVNAGPVSSLLISLHFYIAKGSDSILAFVYFTSNESPASAQDAWTGFSDRVGHGK